MNQAAAGVAFIDVAGKNPIALFKQWQDEIVNAGHGLYFTHTMCLATSSKDGKVTNRNLMLRNYDENGFEFATTNQGRKYKQIMENPCVASTFLWNYRSNGKDILKQVRIEGSVKQLSSEKCQHFYDSEGLYGKILVNVCDQGKVIQWDELKKRYDDVVNSKTVPPMPENWVGFQIVPERMIFFYSWDNYIPDTVDFTKVDGKWNFVHVCT